MYSMWSTGAVQKEEDKIVDCINMEQTPKSRGERERQTINDLFCLPKRVQDTIYIYQFNDQFKVSVIQTVQ